MTNVLTLLKYALSSMAFAIPVLWGIQPLNLRPFIKRQVSCISLPTSKECVMEFPVVVYSEIGEEVIDSREDMNDEMGFCSNCKSLVLFNWTYFHPLSIDPPEPYCPLCRSFEIDPWDEMDSY